MNDHLSGKELSIRFTASAFRELMSIYVFSCFPFGFEGRMRDLIVSVPDNCLSFYFFTFYFFVHCISTYWQDTTSNNLFYLCVKFLTNI